MRPPVSGGRSSPGTVATRKLESSFSNEGKGSVVGPWPGPDLITLRGSRSSLDFSIAGYGAFLPAPTNEYRPMVPVVAALSYKKDSLDLEV